MPDPQSEIWYHWRRMESSWENRKGLQNIYRAVGIDEVDEGTLTARARQLASYVGQAREYCQIAMSASSERTRPLVLYYGILAMTRALCILRDRSFPRADNLFHGIKEADRRSNPSPDLSGYSVVPGRTGTFVRLTEFAPSLRQGMCRWTIADLAGQIPELVSDYWAVYEKPPTIIPLNRVHVRRAGNEFYGEVNWFEGWAQGLPKVVGIDLDHHFERVHAPGIDGLAFAQTKRTWSPINSRGGVEEVLGLFRKFVLWGVDGMPYMVHSGTDQEVLSAESAQFALIFLLSSIVRYRPETWDEVMSGTSSALPSLIGKFLATISAFFPIRVWNRANIVHSEPIQLTSPWAVGSERLVTLESGGIELER